MYEARRDDPASLGAKPLVVISRDLERGPQSDDDEKLREERRAWQEDLARLSANARLVVAEGSGHHVQIERPDVVIDEIRRILDDLARPPGGAGVARR